MTALAHIGALVFAALGAGTLFAVRREIGVPGVIATLVMTVGMADAMTIGVLPPVFWFAILLASAILVAGGARLAPGAAARRPGPTRTMGAAHLALGLVSTATLILLMAAPSGIDPAAAYGASAHSHGGAKEMPRVMAGTIIAVTAVLATIGFRSPSSRSHRLHLSAMSASTVAMAAVVMI